MAARGQAEKRSNLLDREAQLARTPNEAEPRYVGAIVTAIAATP